MNEVPPDQGDADEVDDLYRRASAADTSRPSESVRRAVLDHAAQLAAQRSREAGPMKVDFTRRAANRPWRRPAIFGTLAAAGLAGLMIAPQFFAPRVTSNSVSSIAENTQRQSAAAPAPKATSVPQAPGSAAQPPVNAPSLAADAEPVPFPAPPLKANDQLAKVQTDKRRDLKAGVPAHVAGRAEVLRQEGAADGAREQTEILANVLATQAQTSANARSATNVPSPDTPASSASDEAGAKPEAQRMESVHSSLGALTAGRVQTAAPLPAPVQAPAAPAPSPAAPSPAVRSPAAAPSAARAADPAVQLRRAAEIGDLPALQALLDNKAAIDARDDGGRTALMVATLNGQSRAVNVLLAAGADPNAPDVQGTTPLQAAMAAHQQAIAAALRLAGAR